MVAEAIEAGKLLEEKGIDARIINIHTIKPLDEELICKAAAETGKIITVEEHSVIGGDFGHSCPGGDLITEFGLRAANIVDEVCKLCK